MTPKNMMTGLAAAAAVGMGAAMLAAGSVGATDAVRAFGSAVSKRTRMETIRRHRVAGKRTPKPEEMYRHLIKAGLVKIVRRRGKPPLIVWVD